MDQALDDEIGARVKIASHDDAMFFRMRMHQARQIDRKDNKELYQPGDPLYGRSPYDQLVVRIKEHDDGIWVYAERVRLPEEIESLSEVEQIEFDGKDGKLIEASPAPLMIEQVKRRV
jgi:hypothetical protein